MFMLANNISVGDLTDAIIRELRAYRDNITLGVKEAVDITADELYQNIKRDAPKRTGAYKKAMRLKTAYEDEFQKRKRWYVDQKSGKYRLTHLLEYGHAKRNGGRTRAFPHVEKNEQKAKEAFEQRVEEVIKKSGK